MGSCLNSQSENPGIKGKRIQVDNHILIVQQKIASGAYGDIWKCREPQTGAIYAAKQIKLQSKQLEEMYKKESDWLARLRNVNGVVRYLGSRVIDYNENNYGVIVTEFYESNLFDELNKRKYSCQEIVTATLQLLITLQKIHEKQCLHLDIKLENILLSSRGGQPRYFLCDFGSCMQGPVNVSSLEKRDRERLKQFIESNSTMIYRAPEMVEMVKEPLTAKTDIWMLGCVLYLLLFKKHPFEGQGQLGIVTGSVDYGLKMQVADPDPSNKQAQKILKCLRGMLQVKHQQRFNTQQLIKILKQ